MTQNVLVRRVQAITDYLQAGKIAVLAKRKKDIEFGIGEILPVCQGSRAESGGMAKLWRVRVRWSRVQEMIMVLTDHRPTQDRCNREW